MKRYKHITVLVPQGVGDIFWVYQKVKPHCDTISFEIGMIQGLAEDRNVIQRRSESLISYLPDVVSVTTKLLDDAGYHKMFDTVFDLGALLNCGSEGGSLYITYNVNGLLDRGVNLEDIDTLPVQYDIELPMVSGKFEDDYILLYVSGTTRHRNMPHVRYLWSVEQWGQLAVDLMSTFGKRVILTGATFDSDVMDGVVSYVSQRGLEIEMVLNPDGPSLFTLIKNSAVFVGYQSGLNILADNLNVKQVMVYFPEAMIMGSSWVKPSNRDVRFKYVSFNDDPYIVVHHVSDLL